MISSAILGEHLRTSLAIKTVVENDNRGGAPQMASERDTPTPCRMTGTTITDGNANNADEKGAPIRPLLDQADF